MNKFIAPTQDEINDVIAATGLRKAEIARRLDIASATVSGWCAGRQNISEFNFIKLKKLV